MNQCTSISKNENLVIQEAASRRNSIRAKASDAAWLDQGLSVFGVKGVPYSTCTSNVLSKKIVASIISRLQNLVNTQGEVHFYELVVGTGILSKTLLDHIANRYPEIYKHITIHISNISPGSINTIQKPGLFEAHKDHVLFEIMDAANPEYTVKPDFIYHSYLVDSLPTHHFEINAQGQIFEILIKSEIPHDASIIDTSKFPPEVLNAKQIVLFGNTITCPVCFPVFEHLSEENDAEFRLTSLIEGTPQQILIGKHLNQGLGESSEENFIDHGGERVLRF